MFDDAAALEPKLVGGKGANLARMARAGFPVPPGFCVSTDAYREFLAVDGLGERVLRAAARIPAEDRAALESGTEAIRALILAAPVPADIVEEIAAGYAALGADGDVAVRSSGTAEDLVEASFAGQHDTYLHILGADAVLDAVRRCWSSLWTARAVSYRAGHGFAHAEVLISVVVQRMVGAEISGVMFTGNPVTSATDEIVINATWGLGEALVAGLVTPDEIVVQTAKLTTPPRIIERTTGTKELRIVRDGSSAGVRTEDVPAADRRRDTLDDATALALAELGLRVQDHYGGFPRDIEWAWADGEFFLLQARPITGVEFSWDADVDARCEQDDPVEAVWTRAFSDSIMNGIVTPSQYSTRFPPFSHRFFRKMHEDFGFADLGAMRHHKFWKGEAYYNVRPEMEWIKRMVWPPLRPLFLDFVPPVWHQEVLDAPFDLSVFLGALRHWHEVSPDTTPYGFYPVFKVWNEQRLDADGQPYQELRGRSDQELVDYCRHIIAIEGEWGDVIYAPYFATLRLSVAATWWIVGNWYHGDTDGDLNSTFSALLAGTPKRTGTQIENSGLQALVEQIRESDALTRALKDFQDGAFFEHLETFEEGRHFLGRYRPWLATFGHRGQSDRDYWYPRRSEDPSIDYRAFTVMLQSEPGHSERREAELNAAREATAEKVRAHLAGHPNGTLRSELFTAVHKLAIDYMGIRDDERFRPTDSIMHSYKRGALVLGERLHGRGLLDEVADVWFLADWELYGVVEGTLDMTPLLRTKIAARKRDGLRTLNKTANLPLHLRRHRPVDLEHAATEGVDGVHRGTPTSSGVVTATARVLADHHQMPRVARGEILVTHSTDPGWNPVFAVITAVVVETGGMLSHASCLAREYGFPAVFLPRATTLIPDGATITVDGDTGTVTVVAAGRANGPDR
jgi:pyruvate,water dikinase